MRDFVAASALLLLLAGPLAGCGEAEGEAPLFEVLPSAVTGVDFVNPIVEDEALNPIDFDYLYNGGGVAVGDLDGDGRPDLYFAGNTVPNKLYLNRGDLRFEDVTAAAGVGADGAWSTGVALVDVNQDGLLDIYVCVAGKVAPARRANRLYVNQGPGADGVPRFEEQAEAYGLADTGYSVHAAFFDYDRDGDLDVYVLTNAVDEVSRNAIRPRKTEGQAASTDRLYRNDGGGTFTDVSREAGVQVEGFGLGVVVSDIDRDGWPDVYVANDFITNDLLYVNNRDGTFTNRIARSVKSQAFNGMGADVADFNNDARPDVVVLDMLPPDNRRRKMMLSGGNFDRFHMSLRLGYEPQYVRNTLQLNNGPSPDGQLTFSEVGQLAGVHETDWSWAPLFADFDNDGRKDLFISNGYGKDVTNLDFLAYGQEETTFGTRAANRETLLASMKELPDVKLPNAIFRNEGDLTFTDKTEAWGLSRPSLSNGSAYADLDGDGDLDVVTNNINDEAFVIENHLVDAETGRDEAGGRYLRVALRGPEGNRAGLGAKVVVRTGGARQYRDHTPYRGYQSTVEEVIHFGLDTTGTVDSLEVYWPDGTYQVRTDVAANQVVVLDHDEAARLDARTTDARPYLFGSVADEASTYLFEEASARGGLAYAHDEFAVTDFNETPLLPRQFSKEGPGLAVGDVDGDGLDDVFVGADRGQARALFVQTESGRFRRRDVTMDSARYEDRGALFFDAEGDGDLDLYVVSGGYAAPAREGDYQDRLYVNDGAGGLDLAAGALPAIRSSGSCVVAADYDADGDLDLFVGGRVRPGDYPLPPRSYLLRNDSEGGAPAFTDVTAQVAPALAEVGLVTSALWTDFGGDGRVDLVLAGEWMPLTFFQNEGGRFTDVTSTALGEGTAGWWNSLTAGDFDADGDVDYVAGNLGLNTQYEASAEEPVRVHAKDFDGNGELDPVISRYIQGESYAVHTRDAMVDQIPGMRRRFQTYAAYAEATLDRTFTDQELEGAYVAEAVRFESSYLENRGDGSFAVRSLPRRAQIAPVYGMHPGDFNGDGHLDLLTIGNSHALDPQSGWADASVGGLLAGDGRGRFTFVGHEESGFFVDGDAKSLAEVATGSGQSLFLATQTDDSLLAFGLAREVDAGRAVRLVRAEPLDQYAVLTYRGGETRRQEFAYGSSYLAQSSRVLRLTDDLERAVVYDYAGTSRVLDLGPTAASARSGSPDE